MSDVGILYQWVRDAYLGYQGTRTPTTEIFKQLEAADLLIFCADVLTPFQPNVHALDQVRHIQYAYELNQLRALIEAFHLENIRYCLLKGYYVSQTYPVPHRRLMSDVDFLVDPGSFDVACRVLVDFGYRLNAGCITDKEWLFEKDNTLSIELHRHLFYPDLPSYTFFDTPVFLDSCGPLSLGDFEIVVPEPMMHAVYMVAHMSRHFEVSGFGIRHLLDLMYFCDTYELDLMCLHENVGGIGRGKFFAAIVSICIQWLGWDVKWPHLITNDHPELMKLAEFIGACGVFALEDEDSERKRLYHQNWLAEAEKGFWKRIRLMFFPPLNRLSHHYAYAKKWPILLPLAWKHRMIRLLFRRDLSRDEKMFFVHVDKEWVNLKTELQDFLRD